MPSFTYTAINDQGKTINGVIEAASAAEANNSLALQGVIPTRVVKSKADAVKEGEGGLFSLEAKLKLGDILLFTKQMKTLLQAGVPITQIFEILEEQSEKPGLKKILRTMGQDVKEGSTLTDIFQKHQKVFSKLYCSLINAGEISGNLAEILDRITYILEHEKKVKGDIKSALAYPKMVFITLGGAFFFLLTFVIPKFVGVFNNAHLELPLPTKVCIWMYETLQADWYYLLGGSLAIFFGLRYYFKTENGNLLKDATILKLPIVGPLFVKTAMSRFASILSILLSSGVPILASMRIISEAIGNASIAREFDRLKDQMEEGQGISKPLRASKQFTPMVINMIAIGEESGSLEEMLREIAVHYDEEVEYSAKGMSEAIGPIMIVGLTAVVGFFALAIFLPMWDLTKMVK